MHSKTFVKNIMIVATLLSPLALLMVSAYSSTTKIHVAESHVMCWVFIASAFGITLLNFYFSFIRTALYARAHGNSLEGYKFVSGIPVAGSILVALAVLTSWGNLFVAIAGLPLLILDTSGSIYFLIAVSRDPSFWQ